MKKIALLSAGGLLIAAFAAASVSVDAGPASLVTSAIKAPSSSNPIALFSVTINQTAGETLSSLSIMLNDNGVSGVTGSNIASVAVYKDNGDGNFSSGSDLLAGTQASVSIGATTTVTTTSNNSLNGGKFFVTMSTSGTWSDTAPADSVTATFPALGIATSENSPTVAAVTTSAITADTTGPVLSSAVAKNTGGTGAKEAGDSVEFTFNEATNKPVINASNINSVLALNNAHSFLDGAGQLGSASWNSEGTLLTISLSASTSVPTVGVGDLATVSGSVIKDATGNNATGAQTIGGTFGSGDTTGPILSSVTAKNTGGTNGKTAGDSVEFIFNEATNKPVINASNINTVFSLNNSHSFLDGAGQIGSGSWNSDGTLYTLTLSASSSLPSVVVGDTVTVAGSVIKDSSNNNATGSKIIGGNFGGAVSDDDDDDDEKEHGKRCDNGLINGRLYKTSAGETVYLAAACRLKPFRGAAVFHARGHKFQNIIVLGSTSNITISDKPALPSGGTLVKGSDATVWIITSNQRRRGFKTAVKFLSLGFSFDKVKIISDQDLETILKDLPIEDNENHPQGSVIRCSNSPTIFEIKGNAKHGFRTADSFLSRGHAWEHVAVIDCQRFSYPEKQPVE